MDTYTLHMTPEESERVQKTVRDRAQQCQDQAGQPWESNDAVSLRQEAVQTSLMNDMASSIFGLGTAASQKSQESMVAYSIGDPYPPCTATSTADLEPMQLSDLRMETHHRGKVLSLRRISPVVELKASSWTAVKARDDTAGDDAPAARLEVFLHKLTLGGKDLLDSGIEYLVKEPYFTLNNQGMRCIRIDHPTDLVVTAHADEPEAWRQASSSPATTEDKTATQYKEQGNAALQKQNFYMAHVCYTQGLKLLTSKGSQDDSDKELQRNIHRNRAHVNLILERFDQAKTDALAALGSNDKELDAKAYYRAGSAAYKLGSDYEEARTYFDKSLQLQPENNQNAKVHLKMIQKRLDEVNTGNYDFNKLMASLPKTKGILDVASFPGNTEIKKSSNPDAGRGLFATQDFATSDIILCEKAFCTAYSSEDKAFSAITCDMRRDAAIRVFPAGLHRALVSKLLNNPSRAGEVLDLCSEYAGFGTASPAGPPADGTTTVVDTFQIHDIIQRNAFSAGKQSETEDVKTASTGVWVRSAYINHSCVFNAKKDVVGDLMVYRATRPIAAGDEITSCYDANPVLEERATTLDLTWGFTCRCPLCLAEEADGADLRKQRRAKEEEAWAVMQREDPRRAKLVAVSKIKRCRKLINDTYDEKRYKELPRRALENIDLWLQATNS